MVPIENYTKGLLLPIERKSVEPMAARLAPGNVRQMHQSLHHIVAEAAWSDEGLLQASPRTGVAGDDPAAELAAWIVDDTGFPKKGTHSVGVTRQYCGQLGKQENCRVAVSVSLATEQASLPVRLPVYLPELWANDQERREKPAFPQKSVSKPSRRSLSNRFVRWSKKMCRAAWFWPMPHMATITVFVKVWKRWNFHMRLASSPRLQFGLRA